MNVAQLFSTACPLWLHKYPAICAAGCSTRRVGARGRLGTLQRGIPQWHALPASRGFSLTRTPDQERLRTYKHSSKLVTRVSRDCIVPLPPALRDELLPVSATGEQYAFYWGSFDTISQRLALSLLGTMICYGADNVLLSVFMAFFWLWAPVAFAAKRNLSIKDLKFPGIWEATVMRVSFAKRASTLEEDIRRRGDDMFSPVAAGRKYMQLVVGDASGFAIELEVPSQREYRQIRVGDPAHMLILSDQPSLRRFNVLRDVFLPERRLWVAEYPHIQRALYESLVDSMPPRMMRENEYAGPGGPGGAVADYGNSGMGWGGPMREGQGGAWDGSSREPGGGGDGGDGGGVGWQYRQGRRGGLVRRDRSFEYGYEGESGGENEWSGPAREATQTEDAYRYGSNNREEEWQGAGRDQPAGWRPGVVDVQRETRGRAPPGEGRVGTGDGSRGGGVGPMDDWDDRPQRKGRQLPDDW